MTDRVIIQWIVLLTFALIGPVNLPAAGADLKKGEFRRRQFHEPLLATGSHDLRVAPNSEAPIVAEAIELGEPMNVLKVWHQRRGAPWLLVKTPSGKGWLSLNG